MKKDVIRVGFIEKTRNDSNLKIEFQKNVSIRFKMAYLFVVL